MKYLDYYKRGLYNHLLASQDPEHGGFVYYTSMRPGHYRVYSNEHDAFWCCVGTGMEDHARYGELIYAHKNDDLYVNLFIPSELRWAAKGLTLRQETRFPDEDRTTLTFRLDHPAAAHAQAALARLDCTGADGRAGQRNARARSCIGRARFVRGTLAARGRPATPWPIDLPEGRDGRVPAAEPGSGKALRCVPGRPDRAGSPAWLIRAETGRLPLGDPLAAKALPLANTPALEAPAANPAERVEPVPGPACLPAEDPGPARRGEAGAVFPHSPRAVRDLLPHPQLGRA